MGLAVVTVGRLTTWLQPIVTLSLHTMRLVTWWSNATLLRQFVRGQVRMWCGASNQLAVLGLRRIVPQVHAVPCVRHAERMEGAQDLTRPVSEGWTIRCLG